MPELLPGYIEPFLATPNSVISSADHNAGVAGNIEWAHDSIVRLEALVPDPSGSGLVLLSGVGAVAAFGQVGAAGIADGAVTGAKLAAGSVDGSKVVDGSLTGADIADNSVSGTKLTESTVTGGKLVDATIPGSKIAPNAVGGGHLADGAVGYNKISAANSPSVGQVLSFNGAQFQWQTIGAVAGVPSGVVLYWPGSAGTIPAGYTTDTAAVDRFIVGAGSTYSVGATGGATSHQHGASGLGISGFTGQATGGADQGQVNESSPGTQHSRTSHSHDQGSLDVTGLTDGASSLPPYIAYIPIKKS